jgi:TolA-binding protein
LTRDGKIQPQTVTAMPVVAVLTKALQEQQQQLNAKSAEIERLSAENVAMKQQLLQQAVQQVTIEERLERLEHAGTTAPLPVKFTLNR